MSKRDEARTERLIQELRRLSCRECYKITLTPAHRLPLTASKAGGVPYWPAEEPFPQNSRGDEMTFLCQINVNDVGEHGLLQFFVSPDGRCEGKAFFREVTDETVRRDGFTMPCEGFSPVKRECKMTLERTVDYISATDAAFSHLLDVAVSSTQQGCKSTDLTEAELKKIKAALNTSGHKLYGYPCFCQDDPRTAGGNELLLLQLDSEYSPSGALMLWGDGGIGHFFIHKADLENKDFSDVKFYWDCF